MPELNTVSELLVLHPSHLLLFSFSKKRASKLFERHCNFFTFRIHSWGGKESYLSMQVKATQRRYSLQACIYSSPTIGPTGQQQTIKKKKQKCYQQLVKLVLNKTPMPSEQQRRSIWSAVAFCCVRVNTNMSGWACLLTAELCVCHAEINTATGRESPRGDKCFSPTCGFECVYRDNTCLQTRPLHQWVSPLLICIDSAPPRGSSSL